MLKYLQVKFLEQAIGPERMTALMEEYQKVKPARKAYASQPPTEQQYAMARDVKALGRKATGDKYGISMTKLNYVLNRVSTYEFMRS